MADSAPGEDEARDERLRRATITTVRALAHDKELEPTFGTAPGLHRSERAMLPQPPGEPLTEEQERAQAWGETQSRQGGQAQDMQQFRGLADRSAFWARHHNPDRAMPLSEPSTREFYNRLEMLRTELLGARHLRGAAQQLAACGAGDLSREASELPLEELGPVAVAEMLRDEMLQRMDPQGVQGLDGARQAVRQRHPAAAALVAGHAGELLETLGRQDRFARRCLHLLRELGVLAETEEAEEQDEGDSEGDATPHEGEDFGEEGGSDETEAGEGEETPVEAMGAQAPDIEDLELGGDDEGDAEGDVQRDGDLWAELSQDNADYSVYTRRFDAQETPLTLCPDGQERRALRALLDRHVRPAMPTVGRLARRLQRLIMAQQMSSWEFDREEGWLDAARLARVVTTPGHSLSFKWEKRHDYRDTTVSLLIDCSGSMRGKSIALAATSAEIVAATLERCMVRTEILGFTTSSWKGGEARHAWLQAGQPPAPGRLNDLLHIVFKSADEPWRRARGGMGLMLKDGLLKENIDGEALLWAHQRLLARPEARRILIVISDGAPVDDSTLSANSSDYLNRHLHLVVDSIQTRSPVELRAIGIGHDVGRYYRHSLTLHRAEDLGSALIDELTDLFRPKGRGKRVVAA